MKKHGWVKKNKTVSKEKTRYKTPDIHIYRGLFYIKKKFNKHIKYFTKDQMEKKRV